MTACTIERSMHATNMAPYSCPAGQSDLIYIAGRLTYRRWQDADGHQRQITEIAATELLLLDHRPQATAAPQGADSTDGDDLPF